MSKLTRQQKSGRFRNLAPENLSSFSPFTTLAVGGSTVPPPPIILRQARPDNFRITRAGDFRIVRI